MIEISASINVAVNPERSRNCWFSQYAHLVRLLSHYLPSECHCSQHRYGEPKSFCPILVPSSTYLDRLMLHGSSGCGTRGLAAHCIGTLHINPIIMHAPIISGRQLGRR